MLYNYLKPYIKGSKVLLNNYKANTKNKIDTVSTVFIDTLWERSQLYHSRIRISLLLTLILGFASDSCNKKIPPTVI